MTPMVDQAPATLGKPLDDPLTRHWAEFTGPYVKFSPRAVLRELARYVNPKTGECYVSLETLADTLAMTTRTIMTAIKTLERAGLIIVTRRANHCNRYRLAGIDSNWTPAERLTPGKLPLDDFRLITERRVIEERDTAQSELAELKRAYAELTGGELPVREEFSPEEKKEEYSGEKSVNQMIPSSSFVTPVTPFSGEKNVDESEYDLYTPPATFEFAYVRWAVRQYPQWMKAWEKCGWPVKAHDKYRDNWPKFTDDDLPRHRDANKPAPVPANRYGADQTKRDTNANPPCADCGEQWGRMYIQNGRCPKCRRDAPVAAGVWE